MRKKLSWWEEYKIIVAVIGGLGVLGGAIVVLANYLTLPAKVESAEKKNAEQDILLSHLTAIEQQNNQLISQLIQQQAHTADVSEPTPSPVTPVPQPPDDGVVRNCFDALWHKVPCQ